MKQKLLFLLAIFILSCSEENEYVNVKGRVIRELTGEGISNQRVNLQTLKWTGSGYFSSIKEMDVKEIITDQNGYFNVSLKGDLVSFVSANVIDKSDYYDYSIHNNFKIGDFATIKLQKFIKYKIYVRNTNPVNENDQIHVDFFSGNYQSFVSKIENFGVQNTHYPVEILPGGRSIAAYEDTSWEGTNVNSIIYFNVPEKADHFKLFWYKKKNGIDTEGFTDDIPYNINNLNEYYFDY